MGPMTQLLTRLGTTLPPPADAGNSTGESHRAKTTSRKRARGPSICENEDDKLSVHAASSDGEVDNGGHYETRGTTECFQIR